MALHHVRRGIMAAMILVLLLSLNAEATGDNGGFVADGIPPSPKKKDAAVFTTVVRIRDLEEGTLVVVRGRITARVGFRLYEFRDDSGSILLDIDDDDWNGYYVYPDDPVELRGRVVLFFLADPLIDVGQLVKLVP